MKVKLAVQVFSSSVNKALKFLRTVTKMPEFSKSFGTEKFCLIMNNIFDILNSRQVYVKTSSKSAIKFDNIEEIQTKIIAYEDYITSLNDGTMKILETNRKLEFLGLIISMKNAISIYEKYSDRNSFQH